MDTPTHKLMPYYPNKHTHTHTYRLYSLQILTPREAASLPTLSGPTWLETVMQQWASESHQHRLRENRGRAEGENRGDAALSSFKTMWKGRLIWSPSGCRYPISLLHLNASPRTDSHTHKHVHAETHTMTPFAYTIPSYHCCTRVTQMCFPRISPLHKPRSVRMRMMRERSRDTPWRTEGGNENRGVFYWGSEIGREWKDTEHKQGRQSKGWATETAAMSWQRQDWRKQEGKAGWLRLTDEERAQGEGFNNTCLGIPLMLCVSDSVVPWPQIRINKKDFDGTEL